MLANENRLKRAFYSSVTSGLYQVIAIICGFVTSKLIIENYGSSWNGVMASITKFLSLFVVLEVGINGSTRVALYKTLADNDLKQTSAIINANDKYYRRISFGLIFYVLILAFAVPFFINSEVPYWHIFVMVIIIGISKFAENCWGVNSKILIAASQSNYITNITQAVSVVLNAVLLLVIVKAGGTIFAAKFGSSMILVIVPIALFIISHRILKIDKSVPPDSRALKGRWDVLANSLSNIVHENVDVLFITFFCGSSELSVYSMYYVVADGLTKVFQIITNGLEAGFGNMWARGEFDNLKQNLRKYEYLTYSLAALLYGCMSVLMVPFMSVYMSGVTDANYLRFSLGICIAIAQTLMSVRTPYVLLVQAAGHYKQIKIAGYIEMLINIVLTFALVIKFGTVGAIIGTIVANAFRTIAYGFYVSKKMINRSFLEIIKRIIWLVIVFSISFGISYFCTKLLPVDDWMSWIITAVIVFMVHATIIFVTSVLCYRDDLINCLSLLKRFVKKI